METQKNIDENKVRVLLENHDYINGKPFKVSLYNQEPIVHKLSHQHLYTKFWIIDVDQLAVAGIYANKIHDFAVPILIGNFIEAFNF
jgi:A/G-specific adenine glycosylase